MVKYISKLISMPCSLVMCIDEMFDVLYVLLRRLLLVGARELGADNLSKRTLRFAYHGQSVIYTWVFYSIFLSG